MQSLLKTGLKVARRGLVGVALVAVAFCFAPLRVHAARHLARTKAHATPHKSTSAKSGKAKLRNVSYKAPAHKRRRHRRQRHHITLPKQPAADRTEEIQSALVRGGFYSGNPNGRWDSGTQEALRRFQTANGLPPTGKLDALSLQKLGLGSDVAGLSAPRPVMSQTPSASPSSNQPSSSAPKTPGR